MLKITEVLPNPEGKDTNNEFIEITNFSDDSVNLKNFSLDDGEKGSKPYIFSENTIIPPNSSKAFYNSQTKIALNNTIDSARLFDENNNLIDELKYDKTTEGKSYSYTQIISANGTRNLLMQIEPSPNKSAENLYKIEGTITSTNTNPPTNTTTNLNQSPDSSTFSFTLTENHSQKSLTIIYTSETEELSALTFAQNTEISILASKRSTSTFDLLDYQILKSASQAKSESKSAEQTRQPLESNQQSTTFQQITSHFSNIPLPAILFPIIIILIALTLLIKRNRIKICKQP